MEKGRIAILISGRGSNMQAFIDACATDKINASICTVVSNNPDAAGLKSAAAAGIPTACVNHRDFDSREAFDQALVDCLDQYEPDLVILAGFMRILTPVFIEHYFGCLLNIHPSLLPKYPGLNTHQRALDTGDTEAGVTVHFVTPELDGGPPILQARVAIESGDTAETLAARVIVQEHRIYPIAARWFLEQRLQLTQSGATLDEKPLPPSGVQYAPDTD
ncbi:MAG: phosphoribosylglycinamide formyltransferase [Halioglobus sp.]